MICPNCNYPCGEPDQYCTNCCSPLKAPERKGRHWVPILAMVLLSVIGIMLFFALPGDSGSAFNMVVSDPEMLWFSVEGGVLSFDAAQYTGGSELEVPSSIGGMTVTTLAEGCFTECTELTAVYLPETLLAIGEDAFRGCTGLRGMEVPESVRFIGERAFASCTALEAVSISDSIQTIGDHAFSDCHKLRYIYFLGDYEVWAELYDGFITPNTAIFCENGSYYQGGDPY